MPDERTFGKQFGKQLQTQREAAGLGRQDLADGAGMRATAVRVYERGLCRPPRDGALALARALAMDEETTAAFLEAAGYSPETDEAPPGPKVEVHVRQEIHHLHGAAVGVDMRSGDGPAIPMQRPWPAEHFTGREEALERLLRALRPGGSATLHGPGGIGKSALAAEALACLAPLDEPPAAFPDGVLFYSFYNRPEAAAALEQIARSLGHDPRPDPAAAAQRALANRRLLLVLDGAEAADDLPAVVRAAGARCAVLVTTRHLQDVVGERLPVGPLSRPQAVALLRKWADGYATHQEAAEAICELCGRLPLAVRVAGRYMAQQEEPAASYLDWLRQTPLAALDQGERQQESVDVLLRRSVDALEPTARHVLALFGRLALAPVGRAAVAAALGSHEHDVRRPLGQLVGYALLQPGGGAYEVGHALVHTYARERLDLPQETLAGAAGHYTEVVKEAWDRGPEGYDTLAGARPHVLALMGHLQAVGAWAAVKDLAWAVHRYLELLGYAREWLAVCEAGLAAGRALDDKRNEGAWLGNLGLAYAALGQVRTAVDYYEQALAIRREIGDRRGEGADLGNLGLAYAALGETSTAIDYHEQALAIRREIGDRRGEGADLGNLGNAYAALGETSTAVDYYEQALAIAREIGDRRGEGNRLGNLGNAYAALGEVRTAIDTYEQALAISREIGDRRNEGIHVGNLGIAYRRLGETSTAINYYEQALAISREIGDRRGEGNHLFNMGLALRELGEVEKAIARVEAALAIYEAIEAPYVEQARALLEELRDM